MQRLSALIGSGMILLVALLGSCGPSRLPDLPDGTVKLNFRAVFDTTAIIMGNEDHRFSHLEDNLYFKELRFFISDVKLRSESGGVEGTIVEEGAVEFTEQISQKILKYLLIGKRTGYACRIIYEASPIEKETALKAGKTFKDHPTEDESPPPPLLPKDSGNKFPKSPPQCLPTSSNGISANLLPPRMQTK